MMSMSRHGKGMILLLAVLGCMEFMSALALHALDLKLIPYPWHWMVLLKKGFYSEVVFGALVVMPLLGVGLGYVSKGFYRYLSLIGIGGILFAMFSGLLGLLFFELGWGYELELTRLIPELWALKNNPNDLKHLLWAQGASFLLLMCLGSVWAFERWRPARRALGNAHFASGFEIKKEGFLDKRDESIIIGKTLGAPLYSNGFEHVLAFAPTGSGKTSSIAMPNLFHYPYSMVCNDLKLSLFKTTSGYREQVLGHKCYCWSLTNAEGFTHRYNPMSFISSDKLLRITDIQRTAHILIPDNSKEAGIWAKESRKLFKALALYLLDTPERPTSLGEMNRLVKQEQFDTWLNQLLTETECYDPEFYRNGFSYINAHEETRTSILISFSGYLELFDDPIVDAATSASDFDIRTLRSEKTTIYIGYTDEDMERLAPILTLFWQQVISAMIKEVPDPIKEPYPLLCLIDEFSSLGRIERLRRSLKLLREYRVRCVLMFQYISQTYERYSHDEAKAFTNIKTKIAYGCDDISDAEYISKMLGTRTQKVISRSISNQANGGVNDSKNISYQAIPLMRPDEVMRLKQSQSLIMRSGTSPINASQFIWYKEPSMNNLPRTPTVVPQQIIQQTPFKRTAFKTLPQASTTMNDESEFEECDELEWIDNE
ncbi:MAG: hypothetical protein LEGION0403_FIIPPAGN_01784 [Legionella sp.]